MSKHNVGFEVYNDEEFERKLSSEGMYFLGKARPTDIDGFLELRGKILFFLEFKKSNSYLKAAQRRSYEVACTNSRIPFYCIVGVWGEQGEVENPLQAKSVVGAYFANTKLYDDGKKRKDGWAVPKKRVTVREMMDYLIRYHDVK